MSPKEGGAKWRTMTKEEKDVYAKKAAQATQKAEEAAAAPKLSLAFCAPETSRVRMGKDSSVIRRVKVLTEVASQDSQAEATVAIYCGECAKVFVLLDTSAAACPQCRYSVLPAEKSSDGQEYVVTLPAAAEALQKCAEEVTAPEEVKPKRDKPCPFWKDSIISKKQVEDAIHITIGDIQPSESGKFRIAEEAKKCLASALQMFLQTHLHKVSLLAGHRGSQTPKKEDFELVELLADEGALKRSVQKAQDEADGSDRLRKRLRRAQPLFESEADMVD